MVICNKHVFGFHPHLGHRAPKMLGMSQVLRARMVSFVRLMR